MLQNFLKSLGRVNAVLFNKVPTPNFLSKSIQDSKFHSLTKFTPNTIASVCIQPKANLESNLIEVPNVNITQSRSVIKFSQYRGIRLTDKEVPKRFFRLDWGMWIHAKCGRHKKMTMKDSKRKLRLRQHVMCNATQCNLLEKMANNNFKRKRYFVDDPYEPYHQREEFTITRRKPRPLPEVAYTFVDKNP